MIVLIHSGDRILLAQGKHYAGSFYSLIAGYLEIGESLEQAVCREALEEAGVYASTGSACSSKKRHVSAVLTAMGIPADRAEWALRFSLCPYTTEEEIDYAAKVAGEKYEILKKFQRR